MILRLFVNRFIALVCAGATDYHFASTASVAPFFAYMSEHTTEHSNTFEALLLIWDYAIVNTTPISIAAIVAFVFLHHEFYKFAKNSAVNFPSKTRKSWLFAKDFFWLLKWFLQEVAELTKSYKNKGE